MCLCYTFSSFATPPLHQPCQLWSSSKHSLVARAPVTQMPVLMLMRCAWHAACDCDVQPSPALCSHNVNDFPSDSLNPPSPPVAVRTNCMPSTLPTRCELIYLRSYISVILSFAIIILLSLRAKRAPAESSSSIAPSLSLRHSTVARSASACAISNSVEERDETKRLLCLFCGGKNERQSTFIENG